MATITAAMVKDLRESTGAGMMDCKAALTESGGDMQAAQDWLRKKGLSKAAKQGGRVTAEGLIAVAIAGTKGVVVEVNPETDFVARNEQFQGLVKMIAQVALNVGADIEKIKAAKVGSVTVETAIADAIATIGENMTLRRAALLEVSKGVVSSYVHNAAKEGEGKIGGAGKITGFVRYALGEGIDRQETDFAAEVAAASGQKKPPGDSATVS